MPWWENGGCEPWLSAQQPLLGPFPRRGARSHALPAPVLPALLQGGRSLGAAVWGWWGCLTSLNLLQGKVLSRAARWTGSSAGSFLLFWCSLRLSSIASPAALPLCRQRSSWDPILPRTGPTATRALTHPGRARGRGPQLASGLAWKRLSPRWRELGLASSRTAKLACSLGTWEWGLRGRCPAGVHGPPAKPRAAPRALGRPCPPGSGFSSS